MNTYDQISASIQSNKVVGANAFIRAEGMPLDSSVVFKDFAQLTAYAATDGKAYEGQVVAVANNGIQEVYVLDTSAENGIRKLVENELIANTIVKYNDNSISSFNIVGEISSANIPNKADAIEISIGSTVTSISSMTFRLCTSLSSIKIPNTVTNIGDYAFQQCSSLTSIQLPDSITNIGNYAFLSCTNLVNILLNDNITNIGHTSFRRCSSLTSISIPKSLIVIEDTTFVSCSNLSNIIIPANITRVGQNAFSNCDNLTKIFVEGKTQQEAENLLSNAGQNATCEIITYARSNQVQALDNEISTKIWIENKIDQTKSPGFSDLSIIKLSDTEYQQLRIDAHFGTVDIDENTLYVISANNINAYGQHIENLTMTDDTTPSEAATKHYVDNYAEGVTENTLSIHNILSAFDNSKYAANQTLSGGLNLNSDLSVVLSALIEVWKMFGGKTV